MAYFAQLDENNIVVNVLVINEDDCQIDGVRSEEAGIAFCKTLYGQDTNWKETKPDRKFRKRPAGPGYTYREDLDAFVAPNPYPSWTFNADTASWEPPIPHPRDGKLYLWDENQLQWVERV
jgi:hypothetical protein